MESGTMLKYSAFSDKYFDKNNKVDECSFLLLKGSFQLLGVRKRKKKKQTLDGICCCQFM